MHQQILFFWINYRRGKKLKKKKNANIRIYLKKIKKKLEKNEYIRKRKYKV